MELFYIPQLNNIDRLVEITGPEARHITRVLRFKPGDKVLATNGRGDEFQLILKKVYAGRLTAEVIEKKTGCREPKRRLVLAQAVLKSDKLAQVVEVATELGVSDVVPFISERVVGRLTETKYRRLTNVAVSAMKSSTRTVLPRIERVVDVDGLTESFRLFDQVIVPYEEEKEKGLVSVFNRSALKLMVVVGPEGGFTPEEIVKMKNAGAVSCSLGPRRLRAETAAAATISVVLGLLGELG
ncbi:MAG: RsmE family RNA methyltransferase [bacterium]